MLASCGLVGIGALIFHLIQFAIVVFRKGVTADRLFYVAVICIILGMSLLDNHIFRILPTLVYSAFLLLAERECVAPPAKDAGKAQNGAEIRTQNEPAPSPQDIQRNEE